MAVVSDLMTRRVQKLRCQSVDVSPRAPIERMPSSRLAHAHAPGEDLMNASLLRLPIAGAAADTWMAH